MNRFHMVLLLIVSAAVSGILIVIRILVVRAESKRRKKLDIAKIDSSSIKGKERSAGCLP